MAADGIETTAQLEFFRRLRCDRVQGSLFEPAHRGGIAAILGFIGIKLLDVIITAIGLA